MTAERRPDEPPDAEFADVLRHAGDPAALARCSAAERQDLLARVTRAISEIEAGQERAAVRERRLRQSAERLQEQSWQAVAEGRADHARQAASWQDTVRSHAAELSAGQAAGQASLEQLRAIARQLAGDADAPAPITAA
ncbi:MAG TPA: hypothetical protein VH637_14330 [Streptosporangiaceae bacterium]